MTAGRSGTALVEVMAAPRATRAGGAASAGARITDGGGRTSTAGGDVAVEAWLAVRDAYLLRYEQYHRAVPAEARPAVDPQLDGEEPVVVDGSLAARLFDLYIVHGWAGVVAVGTALGADAGSGQGGLPGGTPDAPLPEARRFFLFTRQAVALVVRACLVDLERRAGASPSGSRSSGPPPPTPTCPARSARCSAASPAARC